MKKLFFRLFGWKPYVVVRREEKIRWDLSNRDHLREFLFSPTGVKLRAILSDALMMDLIPRGEVRAENDMRVWALSRVRLIALIWQLAGGQKETDREIDKGTALTDEEPVMSTIDMTQEK